MAANADATHVTTPGNGGVSTDPNPGGSEEETGKEKPRHWPGFVTAVVVAVVGAFLTTWFLPAFTRQWNDRQKVTEIKASLVADMAWTTGRALADAQAADANARARPAPASESSGVNQTRPIPESFKQWFGESMQIRGRLLAYFGTEAVERWELVTKFVAATMRAAYPRSNIPLFDAKRESPKRLENAFVAWAFGSPDQFMALERAILAAEDGVAMRLRDLHISGYNTGWRDVWRDLLPP
jgi:hypothetical protein